MSDAFKESQATKISRRQWTLIGLVVALAVTSVAYRLLVMHKLEQSSALFVGLPMILAIVLTLSGPQKSVTGTVMKGITLFLLISGTLLGEGMICILVASPIFYAIGLAVGAFADSQERKRARTLGCLAIFVIPMCLEGTMPELSFDREQKVEVTRVIAAPSIEVERALSCGPEMKTPLPWVLRIGFPVPQAVKGCGLQFGALRTVRFSGAEGHAPGDLVMRADARREGFASFAIVSDATKLSHWMEWKRSEVQWRAVDAGSTEVTWRIIFERRLDPAWYFTPVERAAVHEAAQYMIAANATPTR